MIRCLLPKLFSQVIQPLEPAYFCEQPLLVAFLCLLQALPRAGDVLNAENRNYPAHPPNGHPVTGHDKHKKAHSAPGRAKSGSRGLPTPSCPQRA